MRLGRNGVVRAAVAGVLTGLIAFGTLGAPASAAELKSYSSNSSGFALRVIIDLNGLPGAAKTQIDEAYATARAALPADAQALVPATFPYTIDQTFVKTAADATGPAQKALSILGEGFKALTSKQATSAGETQEHTEAALMIPQESTLSVLEVAGGVLKSSVSIDKRADGSATIASLSATLANVSSMLPAELQTAFDDLVAQVNAVAATAQTEVQTVVDSVESTVIGALPAEVTSALPTAIVDDLSSAVALPQMPDVLGTNLADVTKIANTTTSLKQSDNKVVSEAASSIDAVKVLGGFITADAIKLSSHSEAMGVAGSAQNVAGCTIANARVGDLAGVSLDGTNLFVDVNGTAVAVPVVGDTVNELKTQVGQLLTQAGIAVELCDTGTKAAAADGTSASQKVSAFTVTFEPKAPAAIPALGIAEGQTLAKITIDPTVETSVQAQVADAPVAPTSLPVTGASALGTALFGIAVTAGALLLRRRMIAA